MKLIYKSILFCFIAFAMAGTFTSCSEDEELPNGGKPMVEYIRVTEPESSDSLIVSAGQGSMIAIVGQNLQDTRELWINDRKAPLTPTYITNTSIITKVPTLIPSNITNKMKFIFADGDSLLHDFVVDISEPAISYMESEYVLTGEIATIRGDYFYEPLDVVFTGDVVGEVVEVEDDMIKVRVPEGAQPGPIAVVTNFGTDVSDFWFRDNRNIIADFEGTEDADFEGWWHGKDFIVSSDPSIPAISNQFIRINRELAEWAWFEVWVGNGGTIHEATKDIPAEAFANPQDYSLKFEVNTLEPLTGAEIKWHMSPQGSDLVAARDETHYIWKPNVDTNGEWQTVSIPFEDFLEGNPTLKYDPNGYNVSFAFSGPLAVNAQFGMDNIRVVPNK